MLFDIYVLMWRSDSSQLTSGREHCTWLLVVKVWPGTLDVAVAVKACEDCTWLLAVEVLQGTLYVAARV